VAGRHHGLAASLGHDVEILNVLDDHSRLFLNSDAYVRVKAADVLSSFHKAAGLHGLPASLLTDNGAVFTGSYRHGKVLLEYELERLGVEFKKAKPAGSSAATYFRVRQDKVDKPGKVSLRYDSRLYKIGLGRAHKGRAIKLPIADENIRVIDLQDELIRELTLDPSRCYQPLTRARTCLRCPDTPVRHVPTHHSTGATGLEPATSDMRRRFKAARDAAGLRPLRFHALRHAAGSLIARHADARFVQEFLVHSRITATERYMHAKARPEDVERVNLAFLVATAEKTEKA
jgi:Phage integrase family